jgi:hypothetical protein
VEQSAPDPVQAAERQAERLKVRIESTAFAAVACAVAIVGARHGVPPPGGHLPQRGGVPPGATDFRCFSHPHAGQATVIVLFSIILAIMSGLAAAIAIMLLDRR